MIFTDSEVWHVLCALHNDCKSDLDTERQGEIEIYVTKVPCNVIFEVVCGCQWYICMFMYNDLYV